MPSPSTATYTQAGRRATQQGHHQNCNRDYQHHIEVAPPRSGRPQSPSPRAAASLSSTVEVVGGRVPTLRGDQECEQRDGADAIVSKRTMAQTAEQEIGTEHAHTEQHGAVQVAPDCDQDRCPPDPLGHALVFSHDQRDQKREGQQREGLQADHGNGGHAADEDDGRTPGRGTIRGSLTRRAVHASTTSDMAASVTWTKTTRVSPPASAQGGKRAEQAPGRRATQSWVQSRRARVGARHRWRGCDHPSR